MTKFYVDGVSLDQPGKWAVSALTAPATPASQESAQLRLSSRPGVVSKRLSWGTGTQRLTLNLHGSPVEPAVADLKSLLGRARVFRLEEDGLQPREVEVVRAVVSEPQRIGVEFWRVEVVLTLQPFWSEVGAAILSAAKTPPGALVFTEWAGCTGDLVDGILRVKGPLTELQVIGSDGTGLSLKQAVTSTQYLFIDVATFQAWISTSATAWTPTASRVLLDYPAAGPLRLTPEADGVHLTVSGAGFVTENKQAEAQLRGKRWWL